MVFILPKYYSYTLRDASSVLQMMAIAAFAMTGVIAISSKGIDLFIACVTGIITAIAGGTVRDFKVSEIQYRSVFSRQTDPSPRMLFGYLPGP
jgi:uncharacterized membrane protein YeiH